MSAESDAAPPLAAPAPTAAATPAAPPPASRTSQPGKAEESSAHKAGQTPVSKIEPPFPEHRVLLRIDEATQIVQTQVRDAGTGRVICDLPEDQWLRVAAKLRAFAATAIVDKSV